MSFVQTGIGYFCTTIVLLQVVYIDKTREERTIYRKKERVIKLDKASITELKCT